MEKDIAIPVTSIQDKVPGKKTNYYLVLVETGVKRKNLVRYLCSRIDKYEDYIEFVGSPVSVKTNLESDQAFDRTKAVEMSVPWQRVVSIKNLAYKLK